MYSVLQCIETWSLFFSEFTYHRGCTFFCYCFSSSLLEDYASPDDVFFCWHFILESKNRSGRVDPGRISAWFFVLSRWFSPCFCFITGSNPTRNSLLCFTACAVQSFIPRPRRIVRWQPKRWAISRLGPVYPARPIASFGPAVWTTWPQRWIDHSTMTKLTDSAICCENILGKV